MNKIPVGVLGASGYAGRELCALIARHPGLALQFATANERRGETAVIDGRQVRFVAHDEARFGDCALIFSALPHGASAPWIMRAREAGAKAIDLSSDLRPGNHSPTESLSPHGTALGTREGPVQPSPQTEGVASATLTTIPYGLTELNRTDIADAEIVANPGCYPTAILLALTPLLEQALVPMDGIIAVTAASGVTGAGYTARPDLLFGEVVENFRGYGIGNEHRHLAEMNAFLARHGCTADLVFTPHLLPVARGILATITVRLTKPLHKPNELWATRFAGEPFIEISSEPPALRDVVRRNVVRIQAVPAANTSVPVLIISAAIDNLTKGAAGQAIQNANLMLGLPESSGLPS